MNKLSFEDYAAARDEAELNEGPRLRAWGDYFRDVGTGLGNVFRQSGGRSKDNKRIYQGIETVEKKEKSIQETLNAAVNSAIEDIENMPNLVQGLLDDVRGKVREKINGINGNLNVILEDLGQLQLPDGTSLVNPEQVRQLKKVYATLKQASDGQMNVFRNMITAINPPMKAASEEMKGLMKSVDNIRGNIQGMLADIAADLEKQAAAGAAQRQEYTPKNITGGGSGAMPSNPAKVMKGTWNPNARQGAGPGQGRSKGPNLDPFSATSPSGDMPPANRKRG